MTTSPSVLVTASTETVNGVSRVYVDEDYTNSLVAAGLIPFVLPPVDPELAIASLDGVSGLVLTGGEDIDPRHFGHELHPATGKSHALRDAYELALAKAACERRIPTLAICRGAQIMNIALGGTLIQDITTPHPRGLDRVHEVNIDVGSRLSAILGSSTITANSTHHQSIDMPGSGFRIVGRSPDGINEAAEAADSTWWMMAVQWHPENLTKTVEDWDRRLFSAFANEVRAGNRIRQAA